MKIWVLIVNRGQTDAEDVEIKVLEEHPFSNYQGETGVKTFSSIPNAGKALAKFKIKVSPDSNEGTFLQCMVVSLVYLEFPS